MEKKMKNEVTLAGSILSFEKDKVTGLNYREGVTKTGAKYISFKGQIAVGDNSDYGVRFNCFLSSLKKDGTPSKLYQPAVDWVKSAVAKIDNAESYTRVEMKGSLADAPYVRQDNELNADYVEYSVTRFYPFREYKANIAIDGYISSIGDEVDYEGEETGRKVMKVITRDNFGKTIELNKVFVPESFVADIERANWEPKATVPMEINLEVKTVTRTVATTSGFGKASKDTSSDKTWKEMVVCWGDNAYEDERALTVAEVKEMTKERQDRLDRIKAEGYKGAGAVGSRTSANGSNSSAGFGSSTNVKTEATDEEMNF